jgi:hypothetical protein
VSAPSIKIIDSPAAGPSSSIPNGLEGQVKLDSDTPERDADLEGELANLNILPISESEKSAQDK